MFDKVLGSSWEFVISWSKKEYTHTVYRKGASYALHTEKVEQWIDEPSGARVYRGSDTFTLYEGSDWDINQKKCLEAYQTVIKATENYYDESY
jgi:hypothetical protein